MIPAMIPNKLAPAVSVAKRPLSGLRAGRTARIHHRGLAANDREYLTALGLGAGRTISVCRPGAPCIVKVGGARIGLAGAIAKHIMVEELCA